MTDPTQPRPSGRHSGPDSDSGRQAAETPSAWPTPGSNTLQVTGDPAEATMRPRRRRYAPDTDATGVQVLPPRAAIDASDVGITGLDAAGIADVGLAAAGLDLSAFGIDRPATPLPLRRTGSARDVGRTAIARPGDLTSGAPAPRTTEMAVAPPAVPHLRDADRTARGQARDRRPAPAPRSAAESKTADRVAADRYAEAATDPGWLSATGRPAPTAAAPRAGARPAPAGKEHGDVLGSLSALFDGPAEGAPLEPRPAVPADEAATEVHPALSTGELLGFEQQDVAARESLTTRHRADEPEDDDPVPPGELPNGHGEEWATPMTVADRTGGLEVVVAAGTGRDSHDDIDQQDAYDDSYDQHDAYDDPYDEQDGYNERDLLDGGSGGGGRGGRGGGSGGRRRRRGPIAILLSLTVLAALVVGIGVGGLALWRKINPIAEDYSGAGSGSVSIRVNEGDSLRTIGGTLVASDVIASSGPFEDAAKANPAATGIQPGVYSMRLKMSGQAALDLLLDPASRQLSKVTIPEGLTVAQTLQRLADKGGLPLDQLQAAAADPAALGLPAYADGMLEGFLFPATYDVEPDQAPGDVLREMVARTDQVLTDLQIPVEQRLSVLTEASIVQAEAGSVEDMGKVARVLDNRLADGMPLQLDTTVNYANGKSGLTTTAEDRANPSPYNTYLHPGLPPGAIGNPGEEALRAVLNPTPGDWRFFVVIDPDTGDTRFAVTAEEHQQNVLLFQQWLQDHPGK